MLTPCVRALLCAIPIVAACGGSSKQGNMPIPPPPPAPVGSPITGSGMITATWPSNTMTLPMTDFKMEAQVPCATQTTAGGSEVCDAVISAIDKGAGNAVRMTISIPSVATAAGTAAALGDASLVRVAVHAVDGESADSSATAATMGTLTFSTLTIRPKLTVSLQFSSDAHLSEADSGELIPVAISGSLTLQ